MEASTVVCVTLFLILLGKAATEVMATCGAHLHSDYPSDYPCLNHCRICRCLDSMHDTCKVHYASQQFYEAIPKKIGRQRAHEVQIGENNWDVLGGKLYTTIEERVQNRSRPVQRQFVEAAWRVDERRQVKWQWRGRPQGAKVLGARGVTLGRVLCQTIQNVLGYRCGSHRCGNYCMDCGYYSVCGNDEHCCKMGGPPAVGVFLGGPPNCLAKEQSGVAVEAPKHRRICICNQFHLQAIDRAQAAYHAAWCQHQMHHEKQQQQQQQKQKQQQQQQQQLELHLSHLHWALECGRHYLEWSWHYLATAWHYLDCGHLTSKQQQQNVKELNTLKENVKELMEAVKELMEDVKALEEALEEKFSAEALDDLSEAFELPRGREARRQAGQRRRARKKARKKETSEEREVREAKEAEEAQIRAQARAEVEAKEKERTVAPPIAKRDAQAMAQAQGCVTDEKRCKINQWVSASESVFLRVRTACRRLKQDSLTNIKPSKSTSFHGRASESTSFLGIAGSESDGKAGKALMAMSLAGVILALLALYLRQRRQRAWQNRKSFYKVAKKR